MVVDLLGQYCQHWHINRYEKLSVYDAHHENIWNYSLIHGCWEGAVN